MKRKPTVNKDFASVKELQTRIMKLENDVKVLNKLYFINDVYHDVSITESCDKLGITRVTGHNWLNQWNEGGFEALKRKSGSGGQSKLTPEQKEDLSKIIIENGFYSSKQVLELIKEKFGVEYSIRQVERILRDLKFGYGKPYTVFSKMPKDAEETLKKKLQGINLENSIIGFLDQTACQNIGNSGRIWYKKGNKNILIKNPSKFSVTGIGFQSINGNSLIDFPNASKTFNFINFLIKIRIENSNNINIKNELNQILNKYNIDETYLKSILEANYHDKTRLKHIINKYFDRKNLTNLTNQEENEINLKK